RAARAPAPHRPAGWCRHLRRRARAAARLSVGTAPRRSLRLVEPYLRLARAGLRHPLLRRGLGPNRLERQAAPARSATGRDGPDRRVGDVRPLTGNPSGWRKVAMTCPLLGRMIQVTDHGIKEAT